MTPTLLGRWQTRFLLLITIGFVVTLYFGWHFSDYITPLALLAYVIIIGFGWDILYNFLQRYRWDHDWPPAFQLFAGIWEGVFLWFLLRAIVSWKLFGASSLPGIAPDLTLGMFLAHYGTVWFLTFLASQSLLRIIFPRWRFYGGEWL